MYRKALGVLLVAGLAGCSIMPSSEHQGSTPSSDASTNGKVLSPDTGKKSEADIAIHRVKRGDTLAAILENKAGSLDRYYQLPKSAQARFASLHPGDQVAIGMGQDGRVALLAKKRDDGRWDMARYDTSGSPELHQGELALSRETITWEGQATATEKLASLEGTSLGPELEGRVSELLSTASLPAGTKVRVVAEQPMISDRRVGAPQLLAARATPTNGSPFMAMRYARGGGAMSYFDHNGNPLAGEWVDRPIAGNAKITSHFDPHRRHPIYRRVRPHNGVDYAAPTGTPVLAASSGVVTHAGWQGSWGRLITIRHDDGSETFYAHLSRITRGITPGTRVDVGEPIGKVGTSGASTGPHLHFERRVAGIAVDPINADGKLRPTTPLSPGERLEFMAERHRILAMMEEGEAGATLALNSRR